MNSPTVSVIMAAYNHAQFVEQAINSVLEQEGIDFEFLIADDGSADKTGEVIASINDERVTFFPSEINRGACVVTNELIERAAGEFIAVINSDDYWPTQDKLAYQVKILRDNPDIGACFGRANYIDKNGQPIHKSLLPSGTIFDQENRSQGQWLRKFFYFGNCICHPTILIRKSCYQEIGMYNNRLRQLPDYDMWIRLVKRYPIFISERELINFRISPGDSVSSQTVKNSVRIINEHFLISEFFFDNVTRAQLIEGFSDLLLVKDIPSEEHLHIEKILLYFSENKRIGKPHKVMGLLKINKILNEPGYSNIIANEYKLDDHWFHQKMSQIDTLQPQSLEKIKKRTRLIRRGIKRFAHLFHKDKV
ncbi:MAG: glycosyl transferase [Nitrosospira sp. 56-18]|nr:glycosyltransferase [Nitrosospira sp.]OJY13179.1 MAG: glycosyl transferase [Nitrosospira sp. 56-18]